MEKEINRQKVEYAFNSIRQYADFSDLEGFREVDEKFYRDCCEKAVYMIEELLKQVKEEL